MQTHRYGRPPWWDVARAYLLLGAASLAIGASNWMLRLAALCRFIGSLFRRRQ